MVGTPLNHGYKTGEFAFADLNGDGTLDVLSVTTDGPYLAWNDGLGTFSLTQVPDSDLYSLDPNGDGTWTGGAGFFGGVLQSIKAGDLNQDGLADIVIGVDSKSNYLLLNKGNGAFRHVIGSDIDGPASDQTREILLADVNNDGALDVFVFNEGGQDPGNSPPNHVHRLYVNKNDGSGTFHTLQNELTEVGWDVKDCSSCNVNYYKVGFSDVNNDGKLDAIRGTQIFLGDGLGGFAEWTSANGLPSGLATESPNVQLATDLNADGHADLIQ